MRLGDWTDVFLQDWVAATDRSGEIEDGLLDVWCQVVEPHDLGHAGCRYLAVVREFRLVDDRALSNEVPTMMGESQQAGDTRYSADGPLRRRSIGQMLDTVAPDLNVEGGGSPLACCSCRFSSFVCQQVFETCVVESDTDVAAKTIEIDTFNEQ